MGPETIMRLAQKRFFEPCVRTRRCLKRRKQFHRMSYYTRSLVSFTQWQLQTCRQDEATGVSRMVSFQLLRLADVSIWDITVLRTFCVHLFLAILMVTMIRNRGERKPTSGPWSVDSWIATTPHGKKRSGQVTKSLWMRACCLVRQGRPSWWIAKGDQNKA